MSVFIRNPKAQGNFLEWNGKHRLKYTLWRRMDVQLNVHLFVLSLRDISVERVSQGFS